MKNLSVVIGTCDAYSSLWEPFQVTFNRYWKFDTNNLFAGETKTVPNYTKTKFNTHLSNKPYWGGRILDALANIKSDYVFFILEDYFFDYTYSDNQMNTWLEDMEKYDINRLQVCGPPGEQRYETVENCPYERFTLDSPYIISVQPSIWRKSFLLEVLKPDYSPWGFEIKGSALLVNSEHKTFADTTVPKTYFNVVRAGFNKSVGWEQFRIKENLKDF